MSNIIQLGGGEYTGEEPDTQTFDQGKLISDVMDVLDGAPVALAIGILEMAKITIMSGGYDE